MKQSQSIRPIYAAGACVLVVAVGLPVLVGKAATIPFIYREKLAFVLGLAYLQLSFLAGLLCIRVVPGQNWRALHVRERWMAIAAFALGPLLMSYVAVLLFPLAASQIAKDGASRSFTYLSSEPYARASRGLIQLNLVDDKGAEHSVVFQKARIDGLAIECGDTLMTKGRESFLGYVVDNEARAVDATSRAVCAERR